LSTDHQRPSSVSPRRDSAFVAYDNYDADSGFYNHNKDHISISGTAVLYSSRQRLPKLPTATFRLSSPLLPQLMQNFRSAYLLRCYHSQCRIFDLLCSCRVNGSISTSRVEEAPLQFDLLETSIDIFTCHCLTVCAQFDVKQCANKISHVENIYLDFEHSFLLAHAISFNFSPLIPLSFSLFRVFLSYCYPGQFFESDTER